MILTLDRIERFGKRNNTCKADAVLLYRRFARARNLLV